MSKFEKGHIVLLLYNHDQLYKHICMRNHNNDTIKMSDTVLRKIYFSLYLKGLCVRGSWRPSRTATYWPPHSYGHKRFFPILQGCSIIVQSPTQSLEWHIWSSSSGNNCHAAHRSLSSGASVCDCTVGF